MMRYRLGRGQNSVWPIATLGLLVGAMLLAAVVLEGPGLRVLTLGMIFGVFAISLNIQLGYGGLPSLGHALFFGIGAYAVGLNQRYGGVGFGVGITMAGLAGGLIALLVGPVVLRTRGAVFLMMTLAVSQVFWGVAIQWRSVTNGDDGLVGIGRPALFGTRQSFYFLASATLIAALIVQHLVTRSPVGWMLRGVRDNEERSRSLGVHVFAVQFSVYILTAVMAAVAGALYAHYLGFVGPTSLSVATSGKVLLMVVLGGAGTPLGPVLGALVIEAIENVGSALTGRWLTVMGLVYVAAALVLPHGLAPWLGRLGATRRHSRSVDGQLENSESAGSPDLVASSLDELEGNP